MKKLFFFFLLLLIYGCNKAKTVLICGDHVCVNKAEAEKFFEENLTLEVQILDKNDSKKIDLIQLNLNPDSKEKKKISISKKKQTSKKLKKLSELEIKKKKQEIKMTKKITKKKAIKEKVKKKSKNEKKIFKEKKIVNKTSNEPADICTILEKCSIDEISKFLVKQGNKRKFPDITIREN